MERYDWCGTPDVVVKVDVFRSLRDSCWELDRFRRTGFPQKKTGQLPSAGYEDHPELLKPVASLFCPGVFYNMHIFAAVEQHAHIYLNLWCLLNVFK